MQLKGTVRRGPAGIEVSMPHNGKWHRFRQGPFLSIIRQFYEFLISGDSRRTIDGRTYIVRPGTMTGTSSVDFNVVIANVRLVRYPNKSNNGGPNPSDRVQIVLSLNMEESGDAIFQNDSGYEEIQEF